MITELTDEKYDEATKNFARIELVVSRARNKLDYANTELEIWEAKRDIEEAIENLYDALLVIDPGNDLLDAIRVEVAERGRS